MNPYELGIWLANAPKWQLEKAAALIQAKLEVKE